MRTLFYRLPHLSKVLGGDSFIFKTYIYIQLLLHYFVTRFIKKEYSSCISFHFLGKPFRYELRTLVDICVLEEIFLKEQYKWPSLKAPETVIDLGAHGGETAIYYHLLYPEAVIYAVEPNPKNFQRLKRNLGAVNKFFLVNKAVTDVDGEVTFSVSSSSLGHSIYKRPNEIDKIALPSVTLATLFETEGLQRVDLIKFDVEGAEGLIFANADLKKFARAYIGEIHGDLFEGDVSRLLEKFKVFSDVNITRPFKTDKRFFITATD